MIDELSDEELDKVLRDVELELIDIYKTHGNCEESSLAVATMCLKVSLGIMRGIMEDEETVRTVLHAINQIDKIHHHTPKYITKH